MRQTRDVAAIIESLKRKHVQKYGNDSRYALRIGHRLGVTANTVARWKKLGRVSYGYHLDLLVALNQEEDPFSYDYLYEKSEPGNHPHGKI